MLFIVLFLRFYEVSSAGTMLFFVDSTYLLKDMASRHCVVKKVVIQRIRDACIPVRSFGKYFYTGYNDVLRYAKTNLTFLCDIFPIKCEASLIYEKRFMLSPFLVFIRFIILLFAACAQKRFRFSFGCKSSSLQRQESLKNPDFKFISTINFFEACII